VSPRAITPGIKHTNMKSRITIEVDFQNGNEPTIQILSRNSDDVRDNLIRSFYQKLGNSSWCKIWFKQDHWEDNNPNDERSFKRIYITPIPQEDLKKEADIMLAQYDMDEKWKDSHAELLKK
jgi:hypothetical protein